MRDNIPKIQAHSIILLGSFNFIALQKWEGCVVRVKGKNFIARLVNLSETSFDEEAEIPLQEVSEEDQRLVTPGAIFYWTIGYLDRTSGQRIRSSIIRFRRLPTWTAREIKEVKDEAEQLGRALNIL